MSVVYLCVMCYSMRLIILSIPYFFCTNAHPQVSRFDSLWDQLTFNIYTGKPDSVVLPFLKNHFPYLAKTPESGGWTVHSSMDGTPIPTPQHGMHSLRILKHPFFNSMHAGARLDLLTQEWKEGPPGIEATRVWIYFASKAELEAARKEVINKFEAIGSYVSPPNKDKAEKTIIREATDKQSSQSFSLIVKKGLTANQYSLLFLFYDDKGIDW